MDKARITYLHQEYLNKTITAEEWTELKDFLSTSGHEALWAEVLDDNWDNISATALHSLPAERFENVYQHIISQQPPTRHRAIWYQVAAAAAVLLLLGTGLFYLSNRPTTTKYANDIAPGKPGATLILSNGQKIKLTDSLHGELAKETGISISKTSNGQIVYTVKTVKGTQADHTNTLSTDMGETYAITLPDETKVWLNAASSLTYFTSFNNSGERRVQLTGEAYFEVHKDKAHPFIVSTRDQQIEVLGTHFNINAYTNEPAIKTTLTEGAVKVSPNGKTPVVLNPGQQAIVSATSVTVRDADVEGALAWVNGKFIFRDEDLTSIMRRVALWYDVEVEYAADVSDLTYWGSVSRSTNISSVLDYFSKTGNVTFSIEGRTITVKRK